MKLSAVLEDSKKSLRETRKQKIEGRLYYDIPLDKFLEFMQLIGSEIMLKRGNNHTLNFTPQQIEILKKLRDYLAGVGEFNPQKGIFLVGKNGTGKTIIILTFIEFIRRIQFPEKLIKHYHSKEIIDLLNFKKELPKYFTGPRSFYIEDIGKENQKIPVYGRIIRPFPDLIDNLYGISTGWHFLCSNYKMDDGSDGKEPGRLFEMYGKTITSRLTEMYNIYQLRGENMRR